MNTLIKTLLVTAGITLAGSAAAAPNPYQQAYCAGASARMAEQFKNRGIPKEAELSTTQGQLHMRAAGGYNYVMSVPQLKQRVMTGWMDVDIWYGQGQAGIDKIFYTVFEQCTLK